MSDIALPSRRLSRYRSVRKAPETNPNDTVPEVPAIPQQLDEGALRRSMSRYHRGREGTGASQTGSGAPNNPQKHSHVPVPTTSHGQQSSAPALEQHVSPRKNRSHTLGSPPHPLTSSANYKGAPDYEYPRQSKRPTTSHRAEVTTNRQRSDTGRARTEGEQLLAREAARFERLKAQQATQRQLEQAKKDAQRKAEEAEQQRKAQHVAEADKLRWKDFAKEEQRQKTEAEEREVVARKREGLAKRAQQARMEAETQERAKQLEKERPKHIMAPSKEQYDKAVQMSPPKSQHSQNQTPTTVEPSPSKRLGLFRRRKAANSPLSPAFPATVVDNRPKTSRAAAQEPGAFMKSVDGRELLMNDAPVSAVNHGGRRVRIECGKSFVTLPVTPTTSALQLIRSANTVMSEEINPRAAVMSEVFSKAGVRRPLRMYEHVRDVLNSWDDDEQHSLVIEPSTEGADNELFVSFTPKQKPQDVSWWMTYSTKRGKWDKKWVTLRSDGQITIAKTESGKDQTNVCHMTDFDIYIPTSEAKKKMFRPPKKLCYAIKSQQKSSMFEDTSMFIHVFCSNDPKDFFKKVQAWRSWYLVHMMGEGQASKGEQKPTADGDKSVDKSKLHARSASEDSHYILGSFNNLDLNFESFAKPALEPVQEAPPRHRPKLSDDAPLASFGLTQPSALAHSKAMIARTSSQRQRPNHPPVAFRNAPVDSARGSQSTSHRPSTSHNSQRNADLDSSFNSNGLLGAQYDQLQQHNRGPSGDMHRSNSIRSTRSRRHSIDGGSGLNRSASVKGKFGPPLIDLTPQYKEPPQFQKKGKGFKPPEEAGGPLIENATSPDIAIVVPPSQDWRARPTTSSGPERGLSVSHHKQNPSSSSREPMPSTGAGAYSHERTKSLKGHGGGLLANAGPGWGNGERGHGVMSGNQARGPMLNMAEPSKYAPGSLLDNQHQRGLSGGN
ncbi:hypothetical protein EJ08DRAFT_5265 [Tothia fuscella]|uniref:PH domain-containing protein n=1 Tax=Tothia fuscella TaxID=1048955 RepID=A0A9P4U591_9PEZI|nr:hypothetical protein EJ08DRAFT_5265 [Tothia fuscella]